MDILTRFFFVSFSSILSFVTVISFDSFQRLRNRATWLELQLTLHFAEDKKDEDDIETEMIEDDCMKCQQLRKMLEESLHLPLVTAVFFFIFIFIFFF